MLKLDRNSLLTSPAILCLLTSSFLTFAPPLSAQNGITATQVTGSTTGAGAGIDALWADNTDKRWKMNNNNAGGQDVAAWVCPGSLGGIVYAGTAVSGIDAESCLPLSSDAGVPLLAGSGVPEWLQSGTYLNLQANPAVSEITNYSAGTTADLLVVLVNASGTTEAETATVSSIQGVEGICVANCSTSGTAQIARYGIATCTFDGSSTAGDYIQASTGTAGDCHDTGSSAYPSNGAQVLGRVLSSQSAGSWAMLLYPSAIQSRGVSAGPSSSYTNGTTSLTTVLTSSMIAANATVSFHCSGLYSFNTAAEKAEFGITTSVAPQTITYFGYIVTGAGNGAANFPLPATASATALTSQSVAGATGTNYGFSVEGTIVWNATTAGTFTLGAATNSTSGTIAIAVNNANCVVN
jgi:hypothetical protein